jgi:hypothetical protein
MKSTANAPRSAKKSNGAAKSEALPGAIATQALCSVSRDEMIAVAAYYRAQQRGFTPGAAMDDWILAEAEIAVATERETC